MRPICSEPDLACTYRLGHLWDTGRYVWEKTGFCIYWCRKPSSSMLIVHFCNLRSECAASAARDACEDLVGSVAYIIYPLMIYDASCAIDVLLPIVCIWGIQSHPWLEPAVCCSGNCGVRPCSILQLWQLWSHHDPTMIPRKAMFMLADVAPQGSWAGRSGVWRGTCTFDGGKRGRYHLFKAQCLGRWTICPRPKTTIISTGWNKQHRSVLDELYHER